MRLFESITRPRWIIAGTALVVFLFALNYVPPSWPLGRDSGFFGYPAWRMLDGQMLYRDIWEHKPPGVYLIDTAALWPGFDPRWSLWLADVIAACTAAAVGMAVLIEAFGGPWAWTVGAIQAFLLIDPHIHQYNNYTEIYGLAFQWLLLWNLTRARRPLLHLFLGGVCAGAAVVLKQTHAALAIALGLDYILLALTQRIRVGEATRALFAFGLGAVVVPGAVTGWLVYNRAAAQAWDCSFVYNAAYAAPHLVWNYLDVLRDLVSRLPLVVLGIPALASFIPLRRRAVAWADEATAQRLERLALLAFPLECLFIALPGRAYGHYYLTFLPVLSLRAVSFLPALEERAASVLPGARRWLAPLLFAACLVQLDLNFVAGHRRVFHERLWEYLAVQAIQQHSTPSQPAWIWGAEPGINLIAKRRIPTYYIHEYALFMPGYTTDAMWQRLLADLRRQPPAVILEAAFRTVEPTVVPSLDEIVYRGAPGVPPQARAGLTNFLRSYRREVTKNGLILWIRENKAPHLRVSSP